MKRAVALLVLALCACEDPAAPPDEVPLDEVEDPLAWVDPWIGTGGLMAAHGACFVGAAAPHRAAALDACAFLIDRLKTDAPFWKRETRGDAATWVGERRSDRDAAEKWR